MLLVIAVMLSAVKKAIDPSSPFFPHCNIGCCGVSLLPSTFDQTEVFFNDLWYIISQNCNLGLVPGFPLKQIAYWRLDGTDANITYVFCPGSENS